MNLKYFLFGIHIYIKKRKIKQEIQNREENFEKSLLFGIIYIGSHVQAQNVKGSDAAP